MALGFNKRVLEVIRGDSQSAEDKHQLYKSIQQLFEDFVVQGVRPASTPKQGILNAELSDEFYLQLYRQAKQQQGPREFFNSMLLLALLSNYYVP